MKTKKTAACVLLAGTLAFALGFLLAGCTAPAPAPAPAPAMRPPIHKPPLPAPAPAAGVVQQLLDAHNAQRAAAHLPPLALNPKLQEAAQQHADFMAKVGKMAHQWIGDGDPFTRITADGYIFRAAGENVAWNQQGVAAVMSAWMDSPGHRANILGAYTEAGLAVAYGPKHDPYWCTDFGSPRALSITPVEERLVSTPATITADPGHTAASSIGYSPRPVR